MRIYDITLPIESTLAAWPGDTPYTFTSNLKICNGESVNLGSVSLSVHTGSHADAPYHYDDSGETIEQLSLSVYLGPAMVVDVSGKSVIQCADLPSELLSQAPRLLLKTDSWTDHTRFPETVPVLASEVPAYLQAHGIFLLGLDVPSVDALDSKDLPIHHALGACRIHILESLLLAEVPPGLYELTALPLKLLGADGSPVRAILREP